MHLTLSRSPFSFGSFFFSQIVFSQLSQSSTTRQKRTKSAMSEQKYLGFTGRAHELRIVSDLRSSQIRHC